ncbi:MAG: flagellar biosynthesis protein FlhA [Gammaproteobacteria bacterium]|nr:flagellar biosynthesis protein FlhA [Gammaproteobacteria bacterium]
MTAMIVSGAKRGLGIPIIILLMLAMIVVPLPPIILDMLFSFNISLGIVVLLAVIYSKRPLDFGVFPTVILLTTLMRLCLNIATTRVILLDGHTGTAAAGHVIESFGEFVIGGNYAVGLVVFAILVIINFVVVTKGAGRVSEVAARFTLDAMPGKQMAIDADLNAGIIGQEEAKARRSDVVREADFYGSMDGAGKFVRGDAVAGILILFINIIGGLAIGILQHDMAFQDALRNYTLLTIGDGLVAQIPSLVLSVATAIIVTRVSSEQDIGDEIVSQLVDDPRALGISAGILGTIGVIPGMPNFAFLSFAGLAGAGAYYMARKKVRGAAKKDVEQQSMTTVQPEVKELSWDDVVPVDTVGLEVGYRLIPLVDKNQGGQLMMRIKGVRKKLTQDLGFLIPAVHIRDNLELSPNAYRIIVLGTTVGQGDIYSDRELAINPGQVFGRISGIPGKDPAFGLDAVWIEPAQRDEAQTMGYTVVDPSTVIATHLSHILTTHAHELLGREETQKLLDSLARTSPKLVEGLVPDILPLSVVVKVLQNLLEEGIPIRDMRRIAETLAGEGTKSQDPAVLTAVIRVALGRSIVQKINGLVRELPVITFDPNLEQILQDSVRTAGSGGLGLEPGLAERMYKSLAESVQRQEMQGQPAVLLVTGVLRNVLARLLRSSIPSLRVLSYNEIPDDTQIRIVATVG